MPAVPRIRVIKTAVDTTSYELACQKICAWLNGEQPRYVIAANVHVVMTGYFDPHYQEILDRANLVTPDGMPLVLAMKLLGNPEQTRVAGVDLMWYWCKNFPQIPIFLYGTDSLTLEKLSNNLTKNFPELIIAGSYAPPLWRREMEPTYPHMQDDLALIKNSGARVIFVALGCPKQELWMAQAVQVADFPVVFLGVGAAFPIHAGIVKRAPRWMQSLALEWLYRLCQEPHRLWPRYLLLNPLFVVLLCSQVLQWYCNKIYKLFCHGS
ncbi:MAG: WecB/TagA/CpsF family glycosyltransferase [Pseudanabaenaceae cyanobacterium]